MLPRLLKDRHISSKNTSPLPDLLVMVRVILIEVDSVRLRVILSSIHCHEGRVGNGRVTLVCVTSVKVRVIIG